MLTRLYQRLIPIVQSPWFISLIAALIILPFIPVDPQPYTLLVESELPLHPGTDTWYDDLDSDGVPEKIALFDKENVTGIMVRNSHSFIEQWNVVGDYSFYSTETLFITGDADSDGTKEIYLFSLAGDSILLHSIPNFRDEGFGVHNRLIVRSGPGDKQPDPFIIPAGMRDLNGDGRKELIFAINAGFSIYPRGVYAYFTSRDSLIASPPSSTPIRAILQADIDRDGTDEIILHTNASANCDPSTTPLHDHSSWLMILDNHLQFKHTPYEYPSRYSLFTPLFHSGNGGSPLFAGHLQVRQPDEPSWLFRYDTRGIATDSAAIDAGGWYAFTMEEHGGIRRQGGKKIRIAVLTDEAVIELYDTTLNHLRTIGPKGLARPVTQLDIDGDGAQEIIVPGYHNGNVTVFRSGLKHPASLSHAIAPGIFHFRGIASERGNPLLLAGVSGDQQYMLRYEKNRLFLLGYAVHPGVYIGLLLFALMVQRIQRRKMQQQYITEKQIAGLQLNLIRNQLDPHFTMNALNSIIYSVKKQDPDTVAERLTRFSDLYRNMLLTAGEIRRSLDSELAFCSDYLALERMRFDGKFDYSIDVGETVDRQVMVPKMAVQVFAENAVKHGIAVLRSGGMIRICTVMEGPWLVITVSDNGVGRARAQKLGSLSTSKGLQLTEDFFAVYRKYYHQEITLEVRDLKDEEARDLKKAKAHAMAEAKVQDSAEAEGDGTGTLVEIRMLNPVGRIQGHDGYK